LVRWTGYNGGALSSYLDTEAKPTEQRKPHWSWDCLFRHCWPPYWWLGRLRTPHPMN